MKPRSLLFRLSVLTLLSIKLDCAFAVDPPVLTGGAPVSVTAEVLRAKIKEVEATAGVDEATTAKLTERYRKALSNLETATANDAAAETFAQVRLTAPAEAKAIREALERIQKATPAAELRISEKTSLAETEQLLLKEKADLAAVEAKLADLDKQLAIQGERPNVIRQRLTEAKQLQESIAAELKLPAPADELPKLTQARRWRLETQGLALSAEIRMLDQELLSQPMRIELLKAQREKTAHSVEIVSARMNLLEELENRRRQAEAAEAQAEAEAAKLEALGKHPLLGQLAEANAALSEELSALTVELKRVTDENELASKEAKRIEEEFRGARQKLEIAGLSQALGQVLREQRRALPNVSRFRKQTRAREQLIADAGLRQIRHNEERRRLRDLGAYVTGLTLGLSPEEVGSIRDEIRELAKARAELLGKAIASNEAYLRALGELDFVQRRLIEAIVAYDDFLDEHLLWTRSTPPLNLAGLQRLPVQAARLLSPAGWFEVVKVLAYQAVSSPMLILGLILFGILIWKRGRFRTALDATRINLGKATKDRLGFTFQALGLTFLLALPWPLLLAVLGWQLGQSLETTEFAKAVGLAALWVAPRFLLLDLFRGIFVANGVAAAHFRWSDHNVKLLRGALSRLMSLFLPAAFITTILVNLDTVALGGLLGKLAYVVAEGALAFFFYRVLHPRQGVLKDFLVGHQTGLLNRLRHLWFPLMVGIPVLLAGLALVGYLYTAGTLTGHLADSLWLVLALVLVHQLSLRWLLITRRRLAYKAAMEERRAAREADKAKEAAVLGGEGITMDVDEPEVDLVALSKESLKLLNTALVFTAIVGLWAIWSPVLPAFGILNDVSLWYQTAIVEGEEKRVPVTLADLALAILIAVATFVAAKRLPALMEIVLLQRIEMTSGGRYAATTLSGYVIAATGAVLAFNTMGASWSQVQWLVAALSVGIGFGLQEIVANFISGLIILFERPIRVGDYVTVGDSDGFVTRIRIRATTIQTRDRKELLVPNKEFITGRLLNWSLSDQTTRIMIPVGVAYGSDVKKAMALMDEAADEHLDVLPEPAPRVTFETFGDNSLGLILRCFVASTDYRIPTISDLHEAINTKFSSAGIVIAFPQRDLHLDTSRPLDIRVHRDDGRPDVAR